MTLNSIIHAEVRKLYPGAEVPEFEFSTPADGALIMTYGSRRRLCALAEGFIQGTADHFGQTVVIAQPQCMNRGDEKCVLALKFQ